MFWFFSTYKNISGHFQTSFTFYCIFCSLTHIPGIKLILSRRNVYQKLFCKYFVKFSSNSKFLSKVSKIQTKEIIGTLKQERVNARKSIMSLKTHNTALSVAMSQIS